MRAHILLLTLPLAAACSAPAAPTTPKVPAVVGIYHGQLRWEVQGVQFPDQPTRLTVWDDGSVDGVLMCPLQDLLLPRMSCRGACREVSTVDDRLCGLTSLESGFVEVDGQVARTSLVVRTALCGRWRLDGALAR